MSVLKLDIKRQEEVRTGLENSGLLFLNAESRSTSYPQNLIILGVPRSGTSMVAGMFHHLGVFMGVHHDMVTFEDLDLSSAVELRNTEKIRNIIKEYNQSHKIWAWKRPSAIEYIEEIQNEFTNPYFIVVFRDIFSIANRNRISASSELFKNMLLQLKLHEKLINFLITCKRPCILIANDKMLHNRQYFIDEICNFLNIGTPEQKKKALEFIQPSSINYLHHTRVTQAIGHIDAVTKFMVSGWAKYIHQKKPAEVSLLINGQRVATSIADIHREDLVRNNIGDGKHGFRFDITDTQLIKPGAEIRVRVVDDVIDINNSPWIFSEK